MKRFNVKQLKKSAIMLAVMAFCILCVPTNARASETTGDSESAITDNGTALADYKMEIKSINNTKSGIKITWNKVSSATSYYIYRKTSGESYSRIKKISKNTTVSYTDTSAKAGEKYYYCIKAYNSSATSASGTSKSIRRLTPGNVTKVSNTQSGIKVKWEKVTGASGYYIYRKTSGGSYSKIATVKGGSEVSYIDTSGSSGKKYTYCVKAYSGSSTGTYETSKSKYCLFAPLITSAKSDGSTNITIKWKKRSGVSGYQIIYDTSPTFSTAPQLALASGVSTLTKTLSSLKEGKTYYIKIRSYKKVNGKTYFSAWGNVKTVKKTKAYTASIPSGAYSYNGHYYYIYDDNKADSRVDAIAYCTSKGGFLAVITSSKTSNALYNYVTKNGYTSTDICLYIDDSSEGEGRWITEDSSFEGFLCEWQP